jgi:hypothetical protein
LPNFTWRGDELDVVRRTDGVELLAQLHPFAIFVALRLYGMQFTGRRSWDSWTWGDWGFIYSSRQS